MEFAHSVPRLELAAAAATGAARDHLLGLQDPSGWWKGELQTNVTMDAEDLFLRHVLAILDDRVAVPAAAWIRSQQGADGAWATFHGGPGDLSTTVEAYTALRLVGDPADAAHLRAAEAFIVEAGGVDRTRVFTRMWLALLGLWDWARTPAVPPEVLLLPTGVPLNIYDFACWARQTLVAISVVSTYRPQRPVGFGLDHLYRTDADSRVALRTNPKTVGATALDRAFSLLDRTLHAYGRRPVSALRERALGLAEQWILDRQEADGSWGGIQPPWVWSILALRERGYDLDHPVVRKGLDGLETFAVTEDGMRRLEACQSPVWDTALAVVGLRDAGLSPHDPALLQARDWLLDQEVTVRGDWAVRRPDLPPGGWAFEFANVWYPDVDDTAEVVLALRRVAPPADGRLDGAVDRAVRWVEGMQCRDGGYGAFDTDHDHDLPGRLPFCDFGEVIDPPSADVTAHAVEMLAHEERDVSRAVDWLWREQEADGSWFGRWGVNHIYGTGAPVPALVAAGVPLSDARIRRAAGWLARHQNADGGWGEDLRSYRDPSWIGRGASTASQTAWALLALLAAGERAGPVERGVEYLIGSQRRDGTWDEPHYTGTGFPWDFSINYHLYRLVFPVSALGRYLAAGGHRRAGAA